MPTYQYSCTECGHSFEQVQSFTEDSLTTCPVCSGRLRKVFNAVGVVFKGSGFYRTDSRSAPAEGATAGAGKGDGGSTGAGGGTSDGGKGDGGKGDGGSTTAPTGGTTAAPAKGAPTGTSKGSSDAA